MTAKEVYEKTKNLSLLLVEDDIDVRDKTSSMLQDLFKSVGTAVDGLEAYELYLSNKNRDYFDIVVTDINMPRLDGLSMVEKILDINPNQEIIVISAYGDYEKLQKIIQMGATSYIEKPLQIDELLNKLYMVASKIKTKQKNKEQELKAMEFDEIVIQKSECQMLLWAALRKSDFLLLTNNYRTFLETIYNKIENQEFIEIENNQSNYELKFNSYKYKFEQIKMYHTKKSIDLFLEKIKSLELEKNINLLCSLFLEIGLIQEFDKDMKKIQLELEKVLNIEKS